MEFLGPKFESGGGSEERTGTAGVFGIVDNRFNRRASVGLIVRAPSPPTYIVDIRRFALFPPDEGVFDRFSLGLGDTCSLPEPLFDPPNDAESSKLPCDCPRGGGCNDFVRACLAAAAFAAAFDPGTPFGIREAG